MNANEPVAWMDKNNYVCSDAVKKMYLFSRNIASPRDYSEYNIPLYTHPADLTDDEIKQIFGNETGFDMDSGCFRGVALIDFARAILRKAQEK